jgi:hypothetical protein
MDGFLFCYLLSPFTVIETIHAWDLVFTANPFISSLYFTFSHTVFSHSWYLITVNRSIPSLAGPRKLSCSRWSLLLLLFLSCCALLWHKLQGLRMSFCNTTPHIFLLHYHIPSQSLLHTLTNIGWHMFMFALMQHGKPSWTMMSHGIIILRYHYPAPLFPLHNHCPSLYLLRVLISSWFRFTIYATMQSGMQPIHHHYATQTRSAKETLGKRKGMNFMSHYCFPFYFYINAYNSANVIPLFFSSFKNWLI